MKTAKAIALLLATTLIVPLAGAQTSESGNSSEWASETGSLGGSLGVRQEIRDWFREYDVVRRQSKMSFREKLQSRHLLALAFNPMALFSHDSESIIKIMIDKYTRATEGMEKLPHLRETEELRCGFLKYFTAARQLFSDSLETDKQDLAENHQRVDEILQRKRQLEILDQKNKDLDRHLRSIYHIPPLSQEFFK
jgi:hypothetical protein